MEDFLFYGIAIVLVVAAIVGMEKCSAENCAKTCAGKPSRSVTMRYENQCYCKVGDKWEINFAE